MTASSHSRRTGFRARLTALCIALCLPATPTAAQSDIEQRDSVQTAAAFAEKIEAFIAGLPVTRERFEVRINRCEGARGELRDDIYAVWVGTRLAAENDDAGRVLAAVADDWRERNREVFRDRVLDNGGVNIAAFDPASGESHSLDSGFEPNPHRDIVGYFSTPCFQDFSGAAPFGPVAAE
ncbi:hypothetical protein ACFSX5_16415 [Devosia albogilva]|uniref:Uncharacterized protein n=1 Tax=Devosia albogilva TaxID=429726 RepID=A0ABW5QPD3_9HYPH